MRMKGNGDDDNDDDYYYYLIHNQQERIATKSHAWKRWKLIQNIMMTIICLYIPSYFTISN